MIFYIFLSILIISLLSFVGAISLYLNQKSIKSFTFILVSLSAGALLGTAFLHLIPESVEEIGLDNQKIWLCVLFGLILFFVLEKIIHWRHCHIPTSESHPHHLGTMNLIGDGLHNFLDGVLIAGAFMTDTSLGIATSIAVILHEIPQEIADFGVLIHSGFKPGKAILFNFLSALVAMVGAGIMLILGEGFQEVAKYIVPVTAGGFIYIATADLLPELKKECGLNKSFVQLGVVVLGIGIMYLLLFVN